MLKSSYEQAVNAGMSHREADFFAKSYDNYARIVPFPASIESMIKLALRYRQQLNEIAHKANIDYVNNGCLTQNNDSNTNPDKLP